MNRLRATAGIVALAMAPGMGCSWIFVTRAPDPPFAPAPPVACTTSIAAPVVDTVSAALVVAMGVAFVASGSYPVASCSPPDWCFGQDVARGMSTGLVVTGGVLLASAIPLAFSAGHGYSRTADCRQVQETQLACMSGVETSCTALRAVVP